MTVRSRIHRLLACTGFAVAAAACGSPTTGVDAGADLITGGDGGTAQLQPKLVPASATGHDRFFAVAFDPKGQGEFYAAGSMADGTDATTDFRMMLARFNAKGELDTSFGTAGFASHNVVVGAAGELARGVVVQSTGKIVLSGTVEHLGATDTRDRDVALVRFNKNGTLDTTFGTGGVKILDLSTGEVSGSSYVADNAWGLTAYADDRLLVSAAQKRTGNTDTDFAIVRLSADGGDDLTFGTAGVAAVDISNRSANPRTVLLLGDGSILGCGYMDDGGVVKPVVFKLKDNGQPDTSYGTNGVFSQTVLAAATEIYGIALQGTSIVTAGYGRSASTESLDWLSLRITAGGTLDTSYGTSGVARLDHAGFNDNARHVAVLPDGRTIIVGGGRTSDAAVDVMVAVLTPGGQPDTTFAPKGIKTYDLGGVGDMFWGVAVSPSMSHAVLVGTKGVGMNPGNDDASILLLPLPL